ncbi:MAG: carotenoid oxygenase family protein [Sphingopyxis sp.]
MASTVENSIRSVVGAGITQLAKINRRRLAEPAGGHPFLTGIHRPMDGELTIEDLRVDGAIPPELTGRYLRNGPNPALPPNPASYHWFAGAGMVHGLAIAGGKALWYRNRWVRGAEACAALGQPLPPGARNGRNDAPNTNIVGIAGRTWAIVEAGGHPVELSHELETIAHNKFDGTLANSYTAHPHWCPATGERHAICYRAEVMDKVWHTVMDAQGRIIREEPIAVEHGPSIHDCAITPDHVLIFDLPVTFSMKKLIAGLSFPYQWNPAHRARVGVLGRNAPAESIIWCDVEPCYVFHPANAFVGADGRIIVDVVAHDRMFARSNYGPDSETSHFERWTIDTAARRVDRATIHPAPQEFPRYDERRTGQPYRYAITVGVAGTDDATMNIADSRLYRHDLTAGHTETRDFGADCAPGEFVFVPRTADSADAGAYDGAAETDGWYIGLVINIAADTTDLVILNANDFTGPPQATIHLPHRIPPGFHGNWVAQSAGLL